MAVGSGDVLCMGEICILKAKALEKTVGDAKGTIDVYLFINALRHKSVVFRANPCYRGRISTGLTLRAVLLNDSSDVSTDPPSSGIDACGCKERTRSFS